MSNENNNTSNSIAKVLTVAIIAGAAILITAMIINANTAEDTFSVEVPDAVANFSVGDGESPSLDLTVTDQ